MQYNAVTLLDKSSHVLASEAQIKIGMADDNLEAGNGSPDREAKIESTQVSTLVDKCMNVLLEPEMETLAA